MTTVMVVVPLPFDLAPPMLLAELEDLELVLLEAAAPMAAETAHHSTAN